MGRFLVFSGFCVSRNAVTLALRCVLRTLLLDVPCLPRVVSWCTPPCYSEGLQALKADRALTFLLLRECRTIGVLFAGLRAGGLQLRGDLLSLDDPLLCFLPVLPWFGFYLAFTFERNKTVYLQRCLYVGAAGRVFLQSYVWCCYIIVRDLIADIACHSKRDVLTDCRTAITATGAPSLPLVACSGYSAWYERTFHPVGDQQR